MESGETSATILLVDDDADVRRLARSLLTEEGFEVIEASNGAEALEVASAYSRPIDLLLTDMIMPRLNGLLLAERLLQERTGIRVLYMSGYVERSIMLARHPEAILLQKPFTRSALIAAARQALAAKEP